MNMLQPLRPLTAGDGKDWLTINEIENLVSFEQELTKYLWAKSEFSQKQAAFLHKYPHFGMKVVYRVSVVSNSNLVDTLQSYLWFI